MKKKVIAALIVLAVLVLAAVGYLVWGTPSALELFPEEIWQIPHEQTVFYAETILDAVEKEDLAEQKLQEILAAAKLWRIPGPDRMYPGDPCILVNMSAETGVYNLWVGENGYIFVSRTEQRKRTGKIIPSFQEFVDDFVGKRTDKDYFSAWYRDDGSLYRALAEPFSIRALLPEASQFFSAWIEVDGEDVRLDGFDAAQMEEILDQMETAVVSVLPSDEMPEPPVIWLYVLDSDTTPSCRYNIEISEHGFIHFQIQPGEWVVEDQIYLTYADFCGELYNVLCPDVTE